MRVSSLLRGAIVPLLMIAVPGALNAQTSPKFEFRGAWVATVTNLDWPTSNNLDVATQQSQLLRLLDSLKSAGINAVLFQVRPECDAFYASAYEPWSYWLTGQQGRAPLPFYDPLEFAIREAHKRGMELHAWFNPYRSVRVIGSFSPAVNHVSVTHPEWNITIGTFKFLDPGLAAVRDYVTGIIMDVVTRYDIDGVHFDDYFYPYSGITTQDAGTFASYPRGFVDLAAWRRDNVNLLVKEVYDSIQLIKPYVKFGISPFGVWRTNYPSTATGTLSAYDDIYCDAIAWLHQGTVDYVTPQLYWAIGSQTNSSNPHNTDYSYLMPWWADSAAANGRHFYPGHIFGASYSNAELPKEVRLDRANPKTQGGVFFRAAFLEDNSLAFADSLKRNLFPYPAITPRMAWKDTIQPNAPLNARYDRSGQTGPASLLWDLPATAADGDSAARYVVYRFDSSPVQTDFDDPSHIIGIAGNRTNTPPIPGVPGTYYYAVTALDHNSNESPPAATVAVSPPVAPMLASFPDSSIDVPPSFGLTWNSSSLASIYTLQVDEDTSFAAPLTLTTSTNDTSSMVSGLEGQRTYHWRVNAGNAGGYSGYSSSWSFTTGFPVTPVLASPANFSDHIDGMNLTFSWHPAQAASSYRFQLATSSDFLAMILDSSGVGDTTLTVFPLQPSTIYSWRVIGSNAIGVSLWSEAFRFRTNPVSSVARDGIPVGFGLAQNYPNPFNGTTWIRFSLEEEGMTTLKVYDLLGREVEVLLETDQTPGIHMVRFETSHLPSGVYFYVLTSGVHRESRKMVLIK